MVMKDKSTFKQLKSEIQAHRLPDKDWFLNLLDADNQKVYEENHLRVLLVLLRYYYLSKEREKVKNAQAELAKMRSEDDHSATAYVRTLQLNALIKKAYADMDAYRHFFDEPYFARMDVQDDKEGYNAYYIGKKGDLNLGIVDWRAPLARRYYQKSLRQFSINEYDYAVILRRALRTHAGKVVDFKNEYLSVRDYLTKEEIAGRDEEIVLDPYLREIISARKNEESVRDIIESIQEQQFDLITRPERESFILQGCAGSGKTMVLLHRLSYLMYNNESLSPRDILVITPSRSFNSFIDELAQVLELEKVRTVTLQDYYIQVLSKAGVDVADKIIEGKENGDYLSYVYSSAFTKDVALALKKVFDDIYGLFTSEECREFSTQILAECREQKAAYTRIKNASQRLRRTVLGEIKEDADGNPRYTKPFRDFMNDILQIEDFLSLGVEEGIRGTHVYFYRQLSLFFKSGLHVVKSSERIVDEALQSLETFKVQLQREIKDLQRYKVRVGDKEEYTYADRIAARTALLCETDGVMQDVRLIGEHCTAFTDFFSVIKEQKNVSDLGKCQNVTDTVRFFYRLIVKPQKMQFNMLQKGLYKSDVYALLVILAGLGKELYPHYNLVFVDEGQDISAEEYALLRTINRSAAFNIYGDLKQNVTPYRRLNGWEDALNAPVYTLNQNYRNTHPIVAFVTDKIPLDMRSIGFDGAPVQNIGVREIGGFLKDKKGLKAVICSERDIPALKRTTYNVVGETGVLSKKKINLLTVYESKGLEFSAVAVYDATMSENERYIAYTRALNFLAVVKPNKKQIKKSTKAKNKHTVSKTKGKKQ